MPVALSYPGVYIEEVPSGVRTITGVPTSIAAFVGRARRGETDKAIVINSFADFERELGGLWLKSQLGYSVRDFFLNGGGQAVVVRLYADPDEDEEAESTAKLEAGVVKLVAASPGAWGGYLRLSVDLEGTTDELAEALSTDELEVEKDDLFNITVTDAGPGGSSERFLNLTLKDTVRRIDRVLAAESKLVRWDGDIPDDATPAAAADAVSEAEAELRDAQAALDRATIEGGDVEAATTARDTARDALDAARKAALEAVADGSSLSAINFLPENGERDKKGLFALEQADLFNILCIPPYTATQDVDPIVMTTATSYCEKRRAMYIIDPPSSWVDKTAALEKLKSELTIRSKNAALFFPRIRQPNLLREGRVEDFTASGMIAGIFARTDTQRGVWKAPAGLEATLNGVTELKKNLTDLENGELNRVGVNCLRAFPAAGRVVWGARTLRGDDQLADEWKYIPVRRTALFIEESLFRGTQWVVFEPNDEPLWAQIRLNVGAFMHGLFRQGAFQGSSPREAYFVKCDKETTTQADIDRGIVNIVVGFAPLKPAEFVVIKLQQMAGQIQA